MTALFGRWHDVARLLEHEAAVSGEPKEAETLSAAAAILRQRGEVEAEIEAADRARRMAAQKAKPRS